jgi:hypothetical protein
MQLNFSRNEAKEDFLGELEWVKRILYLKQLDNTQLLSVKMSVGRMKLTFIVMGLITDSPSNQFYGIVVKIQCSLMMACSWT